MNPLIKTAFASALLLALPIVAHADNDSTKTDAKKDDKPKEGWTGSGELGFAKSSGNSESENLNAKLNVKYEDTTWKDVFFLEGLRSKSEVGTSTIQNGQIVTTNSYDLTANRYDLGASSGYKFDERSYIVGAVRYDHDQFSGYDYQTTGSIGYGNQLLKNERTELSVEIGPGYKELQPLAPVGQAKPDSESEVVGRGQIHYKTKLTDTTSFEDTLLVESGASNTFAQNDAGLAVKVYNNLALKLGYQLRYNSDVVAPLKTTDQLLTTTLVYSF
jgi:putative salt-induced outer membrane protein